MVFRFAIVAAGAIALATAAASPVPPQLKPPILAAKPNPPAPLPFALMPSEQRLLGIKKPKWGLALSGGGLRSAFFSLGVLKSLYDDRTLDRIEMVSSVSGGGYTAYWLYANHAGKWRGGERFGQYSLSDAEFPKRLCELLTKSNFVPYGRLKRVLGLRPLPRSVELYESSLRRTFGSSDGTAIALPDLAPTIGRREAPFLIQNATIIEGPQTRSWPSILLELTPLGYGSSDIGYLNWQASGPARLPMYRTTAVSGAAFSPLKQHLPLRHPRTGISSFWANDGGKSENLGAIALIRRGVENIIVSDAEHDPAYKFEAYRTLKAGLGLYGLDLKIDDIDSYLGRWPTYPYSKSVAIGQVTEQTSGKVISTLYYIKAALAGDVMERMKSESALGSRGSLIESRYYAALDATAAKPGGRWRCERLQTEPLVMERWAAFNAGSYAGWLRSLPKSKFVAAIAKATGVQAMRIDFPQYSTADQSFYIDQAQAFVGLGYLEAQRFRPMLR